MSSYFFADNQETSLFSKCKKISLPFMFLVLLITSIGIAMLYSAGNGQFHPWASMQLIHLSIAIAAFFIVTLIDIKFWYNNAYLFYGLALVLVIAVDITGHIGMGAKRWIKLGTFHLQPSELMKVALILSLARFYHNIHIYQARHLTSLIIPLLLIFVPVLFVVRQPDLGTALILLFTSIALIFLSGAAKRLFFGSAIFIMSIIPIAWQFLRTYQKERVLTFLDPTRDPLGSGYHIIQSKIALGSGGLTGKGFLEGTQSHLNFLPEKQTDFIFTMLCEEFGLLGGSILIGLYMLVIAYGYKVALTANTQFSRLMAMGMITSFFCYVFINIAMVMGLLPVVGKPLPLLSYGGASLVTTFISLGFIMNARIHEKS